MIGLITSYSPLPFLPPYLKKKACHILEGLLEQAVMFLLQLSLKIRCEDGEINLDFHLAHPIIPDQTVTKILASKV